MSTLDNPAHGRPQIGAMTILLVDDQDSVRQALASELRASGHRVIEATQGDQAVDLFKAQPPHLVLLDVEMPGRDGYWTAQQIRQIEQGAWTPIIFLSGLGRDVDLWRGIEAGGDDYLVKPVTSIVLQAKLYAMRRLLDMRARLVALSDELHQANQQLAQIVEVDSLTGLVNRRGFDRVLHTELALARRDQMPLTLILCDVDHFKRYNDRAGHLAGDTCLRRIGELFRSVCVRPGDVACRYGGEEFALVLPRTPKSGAITFARACLRVLQTLAVPHPDSPLGPWVTVSGGITTAVPTADTHVDHLIQRADEALYAAKSKGRNRFFSFELQIDTTER
jgi:diguanylate cyclase (GGDEF)-like protein